jgi:hypothetical protein
MWQGIIRTEKQDDRISELHARACGVVANRRQPGLAKYRKSEALPSKKAKIRQLVPKF